MAVGTGNKDMYLNYACCVLVLAVLVPFSASLNIQVEEIYLTVPHHAVAGYVVLKHTDFKQNCTVTKHIHNSQITQSNLVSINSEGTIVINSQLDYGDIGDSFIIQHKTSSPCSDASRSHHGDTNPKQIHVEIVHSEKSLRFVHDSYVGYIENGSPEGSLVSGLRDMYACLYSICRNNLEYRIQGSKEFYLQTVLVNGHVTLQVVAKASFRLSKKRVHDLIVIAENSNGQTGHTSVRIEVNPGQTSLIALDMETLRFEKQGHIRRRKRQSMETLPNVSINETATGVIFDVSTTQSPPSDQIWSYSLQGSTLENAFTVSAAGPVSVVQGYKLDYEAMTADGREATAVLTILVIQVGNGETPDQEVKELSQTVVILDVNDEMPRFINRPQPFWATMSTGDPGGTLIYTLTAQDPDAGAQLSLGASTTSTSDNDNFTITINGDKAYIYTKSQSGNQAITPNQELRVVITATDTAAPTVQTTSAEVLIRAGTRSPQFYETSYTIDFQENNVEFQVLTPAIEVKSFQQNRVACAVYSSGTQLSSLFSAKSESSNNNKLHRCSIEVKRVLDYEVDPKQYDVTVMATEETTGYSSTVQVSLRVTDQNEYPPQFSRSTYKKEDVQETIAVGSSLITVTAADNDHNTRLTFSVDNDNFEVVNLDPDRTDGTFTAEIRVKEKLDYDSISPKLYDFKVFATDHDPITRKTGQATVRIFMENLNDEDPEFQEEMSTEVRYDISVGVEVYRVQATDRDEGDTVTYSLQSGGNGKFSMASDSGRISVIQTIATDQAQIVDFEYNLIVVATDDGGCCTGDNTKRTSTGTVTIYILTDNLNRPIFPDCSRYLPNVFEEEADAFVIQVSANDPDFGKFGNVTYSIRESNSQFSIDPENGSMTTNSPINRELLVSTTRVPVNVIATDGGNLQGSCALLVEIKDINDNPPVFSQGAYSANVLRELSEGSVAIRVDATDADIGVNADVKYTLVENPGNFFRIDDNSRLTGDIRVNQSLMTEEGNTYNLVVRAEDSGVPPLHVNVTVALKVVANQNELPPKFVTASYTVSVNESLSIGSTIMSLSADSQNSQSTSLSFVVPGDTIFEAVADLSPSGNIKVAQLRNKAYLDYETKKTYTVTVRATNTKSVFTDQTVTINVIDTNDKVPEFPGRSPDTNWLDLQLPENNYTNIPSPGFFVGKIIASDADGTSPNNQIIRYNLLSQDQDDTKQFSINSITGELYTTGFFDREDPNGFIKTLFVEALDGAPSSLTNDGQPNKGTVQVKITITDVNDNPPVFKKTFYQFSASEDLRPNVNVEGAVVAAVDPDSDAVLSYSITTFPAPPFQVQSATGQIKVSATLDYDSGVKTYNFVVRVYDTIFESFTNVTIDITDVNDNPPVIKDESFSNFSENDTTVVGPILTVTPTDIDNDGNNFFYYKLLFTDPKDAQYFSITGSGQTASLNIVKPLDRDLPNGKSEFVITIEVADGQPGQGELYGYATVTVSPLDINDNAPFLSVNLMTVAENKADGTLLDKVQFTDYDAGVNQEFTVRILSQMPQAVFALNENTLYLSTTAELDRESVDTYTIILEAVDKGVPSLTGTGTLTVSVLDENDNKPYFPDDHYSFHFSENQKSGEIARIKALDNDTGINADITYSIDDIDNIYFRMDQDTERDEGVLVIFKPIDYDDQSGNQRRFNLTAYAEDINPGDNKENRAVTYIELIVEDYNDETPIFHPDKKNTTVPENVAIGTMLAQFNATDRDIHPEYKRLEYYIQQKSDPYNQYAIDSDGRVTVKHALDRETIALQFVIIYAIDNPDGFNGFPQNTGSATLTVTVTDINDNFPRFKEDYAFSLMEEQNFPVSEVGTLSAVDDDLPSNGLPFTFELDCTHPEASAQCSKFSIRESTADTTKLFVSGIFNREEEKMVMLPFKLCDRSGGDQQCGFRFLDITILDINDNVHEDGVQDIIVYNYKGLFGNIEIGTVNENDPDDGVPTDKIFELLNPDVASFFVSVESNTGKITLKENVPEMSFTVSVQVTSQAARPRTSTINIQNIFIPEDAVYNSGSIRINGITPEDFLYKPFVNGALQDSMYDKFRDRLTRLLFGSSTPSLRENVQILTVLPTSDGMATDVRVAAHGSPYYQDSKLNGLVTLNQTELNQDLSIMRDMRVVKGEIGMVPIDMCQFETCEGGCFNELLVTDNPVLVNTRGSSFVGVDAQVNGSCGCAAKDFSGEVGCGSGYCYHGGECVKDDWGDVSCNCPDGYEGPRCQKLRQSFDGTGFAMYKQLEQCEKSRTSIEILTTKANSIIMYNGPIDTLGQTEPQDFLLLELANGYPKLRINHGTGEKTIEITGNNRKRLDDGVWHRIDIYRDLKKVRLVVDNCDNSVFSNDEEDRSNCEGMGLTGGENIYLNVPDLLQLGGRRSTSTYPQGVTTERFEGCMKNLVHNAEIYDLSTGGSFPGATDGCQREDDACDPACTNGQCLITGKVNNQIQAMCDCKEGYRESEPGSCDLETTIRDMQSFSYMDWALKTAFADLLNSRTNRVSFHFRTRDQDGVIFSISDRLDSNKYITVRMKDGRLRVTFNLGDNPNLIQLSDVEAANGQWHKVVMERSGKEFVLKMDSGEGRYYVDTPGPAVGKVDFNVRRDQMYAGAAVDYSGSSPAVIFDALEDFNSSCINDIRYEYEWFPMQNSKDATSVAANFETESNTKLGCTRNDCPANKCRSPFVCVPLWENFDCVCPEHFIKSIDTCVAIDYCVPNPCFANATCATNSIFVEGENPFTCTCIPGSGWYGPLCQCHASVNPSAEACFVQGEEDEVVGLAGGILAGIVLGVLVLIAIIILVGIYLYRQCGSSDKAGLMKGLEEDYDDDIRENIMFYDEEGAGEEDQTTYDLSRLRKPDDGEGPGIWDAPDIPKTTTNLLEAAGERPDVGDFINGRLNDADDDPNAPPYDTPHMFEAEGGGSDAGSLSSLNTSSSGSQDYDYLNEWGPKFAKLADMYNNYDESE